MTKKSEKTYWQSLEDFHDTEEFKSFVEREFQDVELDNAKGGGLDRRRFMQLMGASFALSGAAACWPEEKILPYSRRPHGYVPGKAKAFATAYERGGVGVGVRATSYDGRPIKIEGNPQHPGSLGGTDAMAQASVLELYDPDRSRMPRKSGAEQSLKAFKAFAGGHFSGLKSTGGKGLAFLSGTTSSPTMQAARARMTTALPQAKWYEYESLTDDNIREGSRLAFGQVLRTHVRLDKATVMVCLDADPMGDHPDHVRLSHDWAQGRNPETGSLSRLYAIEPRITNTGAVADNRLSLRYEQIKPFAMALEVAVAAKLGGAQGKAVKSNDAAFSKWVEAIASDVTKNRGKGVLMVGAAQPPEVHAIVHRLNKTLGNTVPGAPVSYTEDSDSTRAPHLKAIAALSADLKSGAINTLVIVDANPVYTAPTDVDFAGALKKAKHSIHLGLYNDETGKACGWHVPMHHYLEAWGDVRAYDGTVAIAQPLIKPLYQSMAATELVALAMGEADFELEKAVRQSFDTIMASVPGDEHADMTEAPDSADVDLAAVTLFDRATKAFRQALSDGAVSNTAFARVYPEILDFAVKAPDPRSLKASTELKNGELELTYFQDGKVYDGRYANNGWLQELPNYLTKLTWDNAALMSPDTAEMLSCTDEDLLDIKVANQSVRVACSIVPGYERGSIGLALGYGRECAGQVGGNLENEIARVGVDVAPLRHSTSFWSAQEVSVNKTGERYLLANSQSHFAIDTLGMKKTEERAHTLIREGELGLYKKDPEFARKPDEHIQAHSLFTERRYDKGNKWGMAIDLSLCTGCNSCVTACQAENNIPVVGKEQVAKGREMHWLRIDRYFKGKNPENATLAAQPMGCQQCELAPCEQVCPVGATMHNAEGINDMVYNRCIGTRYCLNNCPLKVRRFNYFNFRENLKNDNNKVLYMLNNPEVTVRMRGVMEKCNYCMQRIHGGRLEARLQGRKLKGDDFTVACAQACPTKAIVFGDLNEGGSAVAKMHKLKRVYTILAELNLKQRTKYLARITNPNPVLAGV